MADPFSLAAAVKSDKPASPFADAVRSDGTAASEAMRRAASTITGSDPDAEPVSARQATDDMFGSPTLRHLRSAPVNPGADANPEEKLKYDLAYGQWRAAGRRIGRAFEAGEKRAEADYANARGARRAKPIDAGDSEVAISGVKFWQRIKALGAGGGRLADSALTSMGLDPKSDVSQWLKAKAAAGEDFSQRPVEGEQTWAALKAKPTVGGLARFVIENGASSLADMGVLASGVGVGAYVGLQSGSIGQQRAENNADLTANATGGDVLKAMPAATASALLEKLGMHGIFGSTARTVVGRIAQAGAIEALTEAVQSPIEYAGSNLGTKAGFDVAEAGDQALAGIIAGGGMGAAMRGGIEAGGAAMRPRVVAPGTDLSGVGGPAGPTPDLGPASDFYADPATGQTRTFTSAREAGVYATGKKMGAQVNVMQAGDGTFVLKKVKPVENVSDDEVLTPEDRASPIPDSVIAAGRRAQAATMDPATASARVDAFAANPENNPAPSPEEAIAALNARRAAPLGEPRADTITPSPRTAPRAAAPAAGVGGDFVSRTARAESAGDATATNPNSSATGSHQFIEKTWLSLMRQYRARETAGKSDAEVLALRNNPLISAQMAAVYARQNGESLRKNGHVVDNGTLYLSHFLGAGGANAVLSADPSTPVDKVLEPGQIRANRSVLAGKTAQQVIDWAYGKMGGSRAETASSPAPAINAPAAEASQYETESVNDFITRVLGDENGGGDATLEEAGTDDAAPETPQQPAAPPRADGQDVAVTSAGREVPISYKVVEADSLVTSNLDDGRVNPAYPQERQPRDRSRGASQTQIQRIASELDPRRLGRSVSAADGAPIVSPEGVVESGNGRSLAIQRAYVMGGEQAQRYRDYLAEQGFDTAGMRNPVLVRERSADMAPDDVAGFIKEANERDTLAYSATEQTQSDAGAMPDTMLDLYRPGDVDSAENRQFVRAFMQGVVGANDQGNMIAADGALSQQALQRIRGALLFRAFGDERLVSQAFEATDSHIRAIAGALTDVAAVWSKMRAAVADGRVADDMDITANINEAVAMIDRARRENRSIADLVGQRDAFSGALDPITEGALTLFFNGPRFTKPASRAKLTQALGYYVEQAMLAAPGGGLFGDQAKPGDILNLAKGKPGEAALDLDLEPAAEQPAPVAPVGTGEREPETGERNQRPDREGVASGEREQAREPVAAAPAAPAANAVTVEEMPSGKSVIIKGASPEQLAAVRAALPEKVQPLENAKLGGTVYSKKHEAKIRAALDTKIFADDDPTLTPNETAVLQRALKSDKAGGLGWAKESSEGGRVSAILAAGKTSSPQEEATLEAALRLVTKLDTPAAPTPAPAPSLGQPVPQRATDKANPNPYVRNGERYTFSERTEYLSPDTVYVIDGAAKNGAFFRNEADGGQSNLQNYAMQAALRKGVMTRVEAPAAAPQEDDAPQEFRAKPAPKEEKPAAARPAAGPNKIVSDERAAELRARLKKKLSDLGSQLNSIGIDPEMLSIGAELAVYHIEKGARRFTAFSKAIAGDLGVKVTDLRRYLRGWYNGARDMMEDMGESVAGMDTSEEVAKSMRLLSEWADEADAPATTRRAEAPAAIPAEPIFSNRRDQTDMFATDAPSSGAVADARQHLQGILFRFASGMSRIGDLTNGARALGGSDKMGVGVDVGELSRPGFDQIAKALIDWQSRVFVDSGAFSLFKKGLKTEEGAQPMDFNAIMDRYETIMLAIDNYDAAEVFPELPAGSLLFVMPDVVGDQAASLDLLDTHRRAIAALAQGTVARPIVPLQKGALTFAQAYADAVRRLGTDNFIVGIPSNEVAATAADVETFVREAKPRGIHFLGSLSAKKLGPKMDALAEALAATGHRLDHLSADANLLRSKLYGRSDTGDRGADIRNTMIGTDRGLGSANNRYFDDAESEAPANVNLATRLRTAFARELANGRSFASITEARKFAADLTGERFAAGTAAAKALDEAIETAVVQAARTIVTDAASPEAAYRSLVSLYEAQPRLGVRTSTSVEQQAYSTPVPLAFLASRLAGITRDSTVYEPSAGNGALLIDANASKVRANELNEDRAASLRALYPDAQVTTRDATEYAPKGMDVVIANPPFGPVRDDQGNTITFAVDGPYRTNEIDHAIAWQSLKAMKDGGRAVLIVGSVAKTARSPEARSDAYNGKAKREFYLKLYRSYNVVDHFTVAGELYEKQGAGWPVDVVVIEGRGASAMKLPAVTVPRMYESWDALSKVLTNDRSDQAPAAIRQSDRSDSGEGAGAVRANERDPDAGRGRGLDRRDGIGSDEQPDVVRDGPADGQPERAGVGASENGRPEAVADQGSERPARRDQRPVVADAGENERQVTYTPGSAAPAMGTLVPVNMQTAVNDALDALRGRVGDSDAFVADRLGYSEADLFKRFGGEQVDAIALAIDNIERGAGFIIGDQTGIGKGRVVAAVIRYAIRQNRAPIFVTEKPNLYKDMYRDMADIGVPEMLGRDLNILMTDAAKTVPLDDDGVNNLRTPGAAKHNADLDRVARAGLKDAGYDVLFTTYSQMQSIGGEETARQRAIRRLANGGVLILDESHNAGGQGPSMMKPKKGEDGKPQAPSRAEFVRELVGLAHGVFYSSATYAKRPDVMDLYAATDMRLAVDDLSKLGDAISKGGVPMQQIVASMLARSGQYLRRERSFDGIAYNTPQVVVDRRQYEAASAILKSIQLFSEDYVSDAAAQMNEDIKGEAESVSADGSTGGAGAASTNFTAIMHNVIDQMLLAFKAEQAADSAIAAIERGEKPVITVANTLESLLTGYVEEEGIKIGQTLDITFADVFRRYLERSRWVSVRKPFMDKGEKAERVRLTDEQLGRRGAQAFRDAMEQIGDAGLENLPGSPIDAIIGRIKDRGYKVAEITGRTLGINYRDGKAYLMARGAADKSIKGRIDSITAFNDGSVDVMVLNQSGATGLSLHASSKFKDQRKRRMIIAQAERNIDTHMQMLGRVHRTGQVVLPEYDQLVASIPAEKRPASVLAKKMASLNANTTGARDSAVTAKDVPDFMNVYGDEVAARVMMEEPDIHDALGRPLTEEEEGYAKDGAMRKVTGRIPLLPVAQQEEIYDRLETEYAELLANKEASGENALEAKTLDLDARVESVTEAVPAVTSSTSPFAAAVNVEQVQIKRLGKPYPTDRVREMIGEGKAAATDIAAVRRNGAEFMRGQIATASDSTQAGVRKRLTENMEAFDKLAHLVKVGEGVKLKTDNGNLYGVVVGLEQTGKPKNPVALGSWKATIALVDASRQITVPFSQLAPDTGGASVASKIMIERVTKIGDYPILEGFDMMQSDSRETRSIITGNILSGFDFMSSKGAIINFTDSEGAVRQGILAPRGWSIEKQQKVNGVPLTDARAIIDFLALSTNGITGNGRTGDVVVQTFPARGEMVVTASKSKKAGGEFFLDRDLTKALGTDFVSNSSGMVARARIDAAGPALEVLIKNGVRFQIPGSAPEETKQRAREVMQKYGSARLSRVAPPSQGGFDLDPPPPPRGGMTAAQRAELDARQKQGMARRGGQQGLGDQDGGLFASERDQGSLFSRSIDEQADDYLDSDYEKIRARLAAEVAKLGLGDRITISVLDKLFGDQRIAGSYDQRLISIALASGQAADTTLDHEIIHALRDLGLFRSAEWTALSKAAAADADLMASIRQRYGEQGLSEEGLIEEAVADMYAKWRGARRATNGFMQSAFQRISDLFAALRRLVTRVDGAADVMRSIERGDVGGRPDADTAASSTKWSIPGPTGDATAPNPGVVAGLQRGIERLIGNGESISDRVDEWRTRLQDRMLPLLRTQQRIELESGVALPESLNPYLAEELMTGKVGARLERLTDDHITPLFDAMKAEGVSNEELETYLYARHAPERNARIAEINPEFEEGTGSGMTDAEAGSIMERIRVEGKTEALERVAARVDALLKFAVDTRVEAGLLSSEEAEAWGTTYQHYVPLRGMAEIEPETGEAIRPRTGSGINIRGSESRRAFGRKSRADNILAYSLLQAEEAVVRAGTNEVGQAFYALAKANPDPDFWTINKISRKPMFNKKLGQVSYRSDNRIDPADIDYTVSLKINGEERRVTMNKANPAAVRLAKAMRNLNGTELTSVLRLMSSVNRFLSKVNTALNPEFVITNAFRDLQTASVNLQGFDIRGLTRGVLKDYPAALKGSINGAFKRDGGEWGRWYREFVDNGGRVYFNRVDDMVELEARIKREFSTGNPSVARARKGVAALFRFIDNANTGVENAVRLSAFKNARERGMSPAQAASLAKNLTVNFNRRGGWGVAMNSLYLFYNASIQGSARMIQAMGNKRVRRVMYGAIAAGALLEALNMMLTGTDDDGETYYEKISDFDKSRNLIVMIPGGEGRHIKIPLPYGYNAFFAMGRAPMEIARGRKWQDSTSTLVQTIVDSFNPIGGTNSVLNFLAPTIFDPVVDLERNRDYADRPIMPEQNQYGPQTPDNQRYWSSINPHWRSITDFLNAGSGGDEVLPGAIDVSPETLQYMSGVVTGAAGTFFIDRVGGTVEKVINGEDVTANDLPVLRKIVGQRPSWYDKATYYSRVSEIEQIKANVKDYREAGNDDAADAYADRNATRLDLEGAAKTAKKRMKEIRDDRRELEKERGTMPAAEYRAAKKELDDDEKLIVVDFNSQWNGAMKQ